MRIGIDVYPLQRARVTGIGTNVRMFVQGLHERPDNNHYVAYALRPFLLPFADPRWTVRVRKPVPLAGEFVTPRLLLGQGGFARGDFLQAYVGTYNFLPRLPQGVAGIAMVYDLAARFYPQYYSSRWLAALHAILLEATMRRAQCIIACSQATAEDIRRVYAHADRKITVIPCMVDPAFSVSGDDALCRAAAQRAGLTSAYILSVASFEWRKNLEGVVRAYAHIAKDCRQELVIIKGETRTPGESARIAAMTDELGISGRVHIVEYVTRDDLVSWYRGADALLFPSWYEGFGYPPLEAMACGIPVVASDIPVHREVLGTAALFAPAGDSQAIAAQLQRVLSDEQLRNELRAKGLAQVALFSHERVTAQLLTVIKGV